MPDITIQHALYSLLLGVVLFIACFLLFLQLLPPDLYNPYKAYQSSATPSDINSGSFNSFSYQANFTLETSLYFTKLYFNSSEIGFIYQGNDQITKETNGSVFIVRHFETSWWIFPTHHDLESAQSVPFEYHINGIGSLFSDRFILRFYDNLTDSASFSCRCSHITLKLTFTSNSSSYSLPTALMNQAPLRVLVSWSYDFASMGVNVWTLLATVLTFQTIQTGMSLLDGVLNSLIGLPLWTAIAYLAYKLITGLIPFLSGGSGE
jgi:hypothetical protein